MDVKNKGSVYFWNNRYVVFFSVKFANERQMNEIDWKRFHLLASNDNASVQVDEIGRIWKFVQFIGVVPSIVFVAYARNS
jgi:hypothetical protein